MHVSAIAAMNTRQLKDTNSTVILELTLDLILITIPHSLENTDCIIFLLQIYLNIFEVILKII